ncbi:unnamed protein product [Allacma fusca]|uniref:Lebercilin domain-containing protein n=1 Tax=Allacma fusca TaxID=39272 RepID=A0A8J2JW56_9HEXA|nr:unnamed protein product [Allacma fusca]
MLEMDDCEPYQTCHSQRSPKKPDSPYSVNYDNEEFYPETEDEHHCSSNRFAANEHLLDGVYDDDNQIEPDEQQRLEKTIFHKAMIGIGPYLVEKAASVLEASRSYSGDLSYLPSRPPNGENRNVTRSIKTLGKNTTTNSRSQSMTKGFQKLRIASSLNNKSRPVPSRGVNNSHFRFQRGYGARKVNTKSSSTSSIGRKPPPKYPENSVNQRLLSARRGMIKELKCRITELENHLREMQKENQLLQRLQHRHEVALSKYEGAEAELPRMIRSHVNEVKSLQENLRKAQSQNRNIDEKMKNRDQKIFRLEEENKALVSLVKQNNLEERSKLAEQLEQSRHDQNIAEARVADLQRHVEILEKNHRFQISVEKKKLRTTNNKLFEAHQEIDKLYAALKEKDRIITCIRIRQGQGQIPMIGKVEGRVQIFADDSSLRSARTLPAKKPPPHYPKDQMSCHEEQLRRQRSETLGPTTRKSYPRQSYNRTYGNHEDQGYPGRHVSQNVMHSRHMLNETPPSRTPNQPVSPPSGHSDHSKCASEIQNEYESPLQSRSSMSMSHSRVESASIVIAGTDRTDRTINSDHIDETVQDDEYYNFENVSVEDDNYHPHKSLFVDAIDSSCNDRNFASKT